MPVPMTEGSRQIFASIRKMADLPESETDWLARMADRREFEKRDHFCVIGQTNHEFAFVEEGLFQVNALSSSGEVVVLDIIFPGGFLLALDAAIKDVACEVQIEALTPAKVWIWPYELRLTAFSRHNGWRSFETVLLERAFARKNQLYHLLRTRSSRERLFNIEDELPSSWATVPRGVLASYLGITPQYLSMIHKA